MSIKSILFIRHGETAWNAESRWQGHSDIPLNEVGISQARETARKLAGCDLEILVSSDLQRARQTAQIIAKELGCPTLVTDALREIHLGEVEGLLADEVLRRIGEEAVTTWGSILPENLGFSFPSGETKRQALDRAIPFIENFLLSDSRQSIGFVSHGALMRTVLHHFFPGLTGPIRIPNTKFFSMLYDTATGDWTATGEFADLISSLRAAPTSDVSWW